MNRKESDQAKELELDNKSNKARTYAVLFELEFFAVNTRVKFFEILRKALKEQDCAFNEAHFSRYCLQDTPENCARRLPELMGLKKVNGDKLGQTIVQQLQAYYADKPVLNPGVKSLLQKAVNRHYHVATISCQPRHQAEALMDKTGLQEFKVDLLCHNDDGKAFPGADVWMRVLKDLNLVPQNCMALISSMESGKTALTAGMHFAVMPDAFTAFQDFGGADFVLTALTDKEVDEVLNSLSRHAK